MAGNHGNDCERKKLDGRPGQESGAPREIRFASRAQLTEPYDEFL
jgi:hypothetical protein